MDISAKYKENNKPENIKAKLEAEIEIEKLKIERDKIANERRKMKQQSFSIGESNGQCR